MNRLRLIDHFFSLDLMYHFASLRLMNRFAWLERKNRWRLLKIFQCSWNFILSLTGDPVWINVSGFPIKPGMTIKTFDFIDFVNFRLPNFSYLICLICCSLTSYRTKPKDSPQQFTKIYNYKQNIIPFYPDFWLYELYKLLTFFLKNLHKLR